VREDQEEEVLIKPFMRKEDEQGNTVLATWRDLLIKEELELGLTARGFHYPSEVQFKAIPLIVNPKRKDVLCQAKSGLGKTAVFLISILESITPVNGSYTPHQAIIVASTR
jgi:ATP-dependent RNA helicase UAP56/SUB2